MPVLLQKLIGESKESSVFSGVVYSGDGGGARIQASPGFSGAIDNKFVDNYYISPQGLAYFEIRGKQSRLSPVFDEVSQKIKLERVNNSVTQQYSSSLDEKAALYLDQFAKFLEGKYGYRMDIEFVYDVNANSINIVQAAFSLFLLKSAHTPESLSEGGMTVEQFEKNMILNLSLLKIY
jgi:hypothetical protein